MGFDARARRRLLAKGHGYSSLRGCGDIRIAVIAKQAFLAVILRIQEKGRRIRELTAFFAGWKLYYFSFCIG
jgi:hypothetical protein